LILLQIVFDRGLIDFRIEERALNIAVPKLFADRGDGNSCLQKLTGTTVAELMNRCLHASLFAVFLPRIMDDTIRVSGH